MLLFDDYPDIDPFAPRARHTDPQTSHDAAASVRYHEIDRAIIQALRDYAVVGLTSLELVAVTGILRVSISPRLKPLELMGKVLRTTARRRAFGVYGKPGIVWVAI